MFLDKNSVVPITGLAPFNKALKTVWRELDARLPNKRARRDPSSKGQIKNNWSNGEISTLIYGVLRLGEKEFNDLMN